jgi:lipid-A-disaccharide synthase
LETAIFGVPQVVCYYTPVARLIHYLRQRLLKVKYISLVNLIADKEVVQELVDVRMTIEEIRQELSAILPGGEGRERMLADYARLMEVLGTAGASKRAAEGMLRYLQNRKNN